MMSELQNSVIANDNFVGFMSAGGSYVPSTTTNTVVTNGYSYVQPYGCYHWFSNPDNKTETAYQVIRALMRAKVLKIQTLDKFFDAMDEVIKAL